MPSTCCCVPQCHLRGHEFPKDYDRRSKWVNAIRRIDESFKDWQPSKTAVVCKGHFRADDYVQQTIDGMFKRLCF